MAQEIDVKTRLGEAAAIVRIALTGAAIVAAAIFGGALVFEFADAQRAQEMQNWRSRLAIVADSRAAAVETWLGRQFAELRPLADNTALQLYMTELAAMPGSAERVTESLGERGYLTQLLNFAAERGGFVNPSAAPAVDANVRRGGGAGLLLLDSGLNVLAASEGAPSVEGRFADALRLGPPGQARLIDLHIGTSGGPTLGLALPIFAVQGDRVGPRQIGWVLGVKDVTRELYPLLLQPGSVWTSGEAILVRRAGALIEVLSPLRDGRAPLTVRFDAESTTESFAQDSPGAFGARLDHRNLEVLVTGRSLAHAPWALVYKIDRAEALRESDAHISWLVMVLSLALFVAAAAIVAAWRHGASLRASAAAAENRRLAVRFETQSKLLAIVTDSHPNPIFILDRDGKYRFANRAAVQDAAIASGDLIGKSIVNVLGPAAAERYQSSLHEALQKREVLSNVRRLGVGAETRVVQIKHVPIPVSEETPASVLVVEQDVTAAVLDRERHEWTLRYLVRTLVSVVDRRDPHAAHHSQRVAAVGRAIAIEMSLDRATIDTVEIAGSLMNLGKTLVPTELLTRADSLAEDEVAKVREGIRATADLLDDIEFEGPVVETLRELAERWDGTGAPRGLKGEEILPSARIVQIANAFVAMVSPRSWRPASSFDEAIARLIAEAGTSDDRRAVAALLNLIDNRGAGAGWAGFERRAIAI